MASLSFYLQFETNLMSNRKVIELFLQLKSAKARGKNYVQVKSHPVRHLLRNCLFNKTFCLVCREWDRSFYQIMANTHFWCHAMPFRYCYLLPYKNSFNRNKL